MRSLSTGLNKRKEKVLLMLLKEMVLPWVELWTKAMLRWSSLLLERRFSIALFFFWKTLVASCFEALTQRQWMPRVLRL